MIGIDNNFHTRTNLTFWCGECLLTLQCCPLCTVWTFSSSHAAGLGALYGYGKLKLLHTGQYFEFKPQHHWRVERWSLKWYCQSCISFTAPLCIVCSTRSVGNRNYISVTRSAIFCRMVFLLCILPCRLLLRWTCGICIAAIIYVFLIWRWMFFRNTHKCIQFVVSLCQPHFTSQAPMH